MRSDASIVASTVWPGDAVSVANSSIDPRPPLRSRAARGEPELLVAAAVLASSPVLRAHDLGADRVDSLFHRAVADVLAGYRLLVDIETPAASARARQDLDDFREQHFSAYWRALREHDIAPDLLADFRNLMNHGEIEMMRRGLARVEAELAVRSEGTPPPL